MHRHAVFAGSRQRGGTALTVLLILVVLVIAAVFILPLGFAYYFTNKMITENPQLSSLPEPLPAAPPLKAKPTTLTCCGLEFDVPWGSPKERSADDYVSEYFVSFDFPGGQNIRFTRPEKQVDILYSPANADPQQKDAMQNAYGFSVESRYDAVRTALHHQPRRLRLMDGFRGMFKEMMLTSAKMAHLGSDSTAIFSFEGPNGRGFQINHPERSREVKVHLFDSSDRHTELAIRRSSDSAALQQSEIDFIVRSIRPAPQPPTDTPPAKKAAPEKPAPKKGSS
jgi:hypothetical protein